VKIVSLLPSATEIVFALGLGDSLEGVTFECDYPPAARTKSVVSGSALPTERSLTPREVDDAVSTMVAGGAPIYTLDSARIAAIQPDLILAQDLCRVCAVPSGAVQEALGVLGCRAEVVSLDPTTLDEVIACVGAVGDATDTTTRARVLMDGLHARLAAVRAAVAGRAQPRTLALEWSDPPFTGGHWVPDMIDTAGGRPVLGPRGAPSRRVGWDEVADARPDVAMFMPCGYGLAEAAREGRALVREPTLATIARIWAVDASALFSRPGPRIVDGVETLAWALHSDAVPEPPSGAIAAIR
jgi:iron complex transport system substrate-binding protein